MAAPRLPDPGWVWSATILNVTLEPVVNGWRDAIRDIFPDSNVATKTFTPDWATATDDETGLGRVLDSKAHRCLILNYEILQQPKSSEWVRVFIETERIDFVVVDEIHYAKQREVVDALPHALS